MNCRDVRSELDEGAPLSQGGRNHLEACPECGRFHHESVRLARMLKALPRVEAPLDFDHRLDARIASRRPEESRPWFFPRLRFILPVAGFAALLAIALSGFYFVGRNAPGVAKQIPAAEQTAPALDDPSTSDAAANRSGNTVDDSAGRDVVAAADPPQESAEGNEAGRVSPEPVQKAANRPAKEIGGSRDMAARDGKIINPPGIGANPQIARPEIVTTTDLNEVWQLIGIKTVTENERFMVKTIAENSVAERAGVKIGDEIKAIDGEKVTGEPLRGVTIRIKSLTILRDGKQEEIALQQDRLP